MLARKPKWMSKEGCQEGRTQKQTAEMQVNNIEYMMLRSKNGSQQDNMEGRKQNWTPEQQNVSQEHRMEANKLEWMPR